MGVFVWLQGIIGRGTDVQRGVASSQPVARPVSGRPSADEVIADALNLSSLVIDQSEALAFYQTTLADLLSRFVTYNDLRKQGDLLDKESPKALGLRANVKLTQFLATLNGNGRADPLGAASVIGLGVSHALCTLRDLSNMDAAGVGLADTNLR